MNYFGTTILILNYFFAGNIIAQHGSPESYENRFFTLNFAGQSLGFPDVEKHFFTTFPHNDPTLGDVIYDRTKWVNEEMFELIDQDGLYGYIKDRNDDSNFDSFRITSKSYFNLNDDIKKILFVFKGRIPSGKGIWPAWWLNGSFEDEWLYKTDTGVTDDDLDEYSGKGQFYNTPSAVNSTDWPGAGEIDIIETINGDNIFHNTIHTCPQMCDSEWNGDGIIINCANATSSDPNSGCSGKPFQLKSPEGTFACLWEKRSISFYYWDSRTDVSFEGGPLSKSPRPEMWSETSLKNRVELFDSNDECDEKLHQDWQCESCKGKNRCEFKNMKMIFNITLCGIWAGYQFDDTNNSLANCKEYITDAGKDEINNQFFKIEHVSVSNID